MLDRLSFVELASLYEAVAKIEKVYGEKVVQEVFVEMAKILDSKSPTRTKGNPDQLELLPVERVVEQRKTRKKGAARNKKGHNNYLIREFFRKSENDPDSLGANEMILKMYHNDGLLQREIAKKIGVNQRAVSQFIMDIPETQKFKILSRYTVNWGEVI